MELAKRIAIAKHINADHNDLAIKTLHSNANGAALYHVYDISNNEHRYVIEGETGELVGYYEDETEALQA